MIKLNFFYGKSVKNIFITGRLDLVSKQLRQNSKFDTIL